MPVDTSQYPPANDVQTAGGPYPEMGETQEAYYARVSEWLATKGFFSQSMGRTYREYFYDEVFQGDGGGAANGGTPFTDPTVVNKEPIRQGWPMGGPQQMEETYGRWPGYGTAMGLYGKDYLAPFQQYQVGVGQQLDPLYDIAGRMGTAGGFPQYAPQGMFSQWAPQYAQQPGSMYGLANQMMGSAFGMTPEQRGTAGMQYGAGESGSLAELLQMGLRTSLGKNTAGWLSGRLPQEQESWLSQQPGEAGQAQMPFLDFIKQKYNLGQYF